jgi:molybdopterin molybdotransferase
VEFLTAITSDVALRIIASFPLAERQTVEVPLEAAPDRVLAADIIAAEDIPPFSRSLVDGYAVKVKDTYGARESTPALLVPAGEVRVGEATEKRMGEGEAVYVATGAMLPEAADGVVMQEYVRRSADDLEVTRSLRRGENICFAGEDVRAGQVVLERGKGLTPFDIGVLAALGITRVSVYRQPEIGLISSGDEVVPVEEAPPPGKIRDINTHTVSSLLMDKGCMVRFAGIARDAVRDVRDKLSMVRESDMILLSGGSSKGQMDFVTTAIEALGGTVLFHGLNIKPGKPTIFANLWGKPVFGLPGHPVSCAMVVLRFVLPLVRRLKGETREERSHAVRGRLATNVPSSYGIEEYVRVTIERAEDLVVVTPIFAKSSVISMLSRADGYFIVPEGKEGLEAGEEVEVFFFA